LTTLGCLGPTKLTDCISTDYELTARADFFLHRKQADKLADATKSRTLVPAIADVGNNNQIQGSHQGGYIFYAGGSIAGVSCRRRWPPPTTLALTTLVAQCELSRR